MPGPQVKNWSQYEALREKGLSKESAARITNASVKRSKMNGEELEEMEGTTIQRGPKHKRVRPAKLKRKKKKTYVSGHMHRMPNGSTMSDLEMEQMMKHKGKMMPRMK